MDFYRNKVMVSSDTPFRGQIMTGGNLTATGVGFNNCNQKMQRNPFMGGHNSQFGNGKFIFLFGKG